MTARRDLTALSFGRLTVSAPDESRNGKTRWICLCVCGVTISAQSGNLLSGQVTSCGCFRREKMRLEKTRHGETGSRIHNQWARMVSRCTNQNHARASDYIGRGITVCAEWRSYERFRDDMLATHGPCPDGWSLDRIDTNGDYSPANCRWAPPAVQNRNRRKHRPDTATSQYPGVHWNAQKRRWCASGRHAGRQFHLGGFTDEMEAAEAAKAFRIAHGHAVYWPQDQAVAALREAGFAL